MCKSLRNPVIKSSTPEILPFWEQLVPGHSGSKAALRKYDTPEIQARPLRPKNILPQQQKTFPGAGIWTCLGGAAGILSFGCCGWFRWDTAAGMDVLSLLEAAEMLLMLEPFKYADAHFCFVLFYGPNGPGWNFMRALSGAEVSWLC
ncbi:hypothetical protein Nepgr_030065 [Nepenthes gracilis]|uniref:Uncharacterized protein n=1 Tax=Nepenthes gracilis TaxID=150966 RepID=A0AAD3TF39_NEPGR|nr:hypothetical protein Nepgr_030065 [Nepenthes gracilis]